MPNPEVGAYGLMQIIPETADHFNVGNYFEPDSNKSMSEPNIYITGLLLSPADRFFRTAQIRSGRL